MSALSITFVCEPLESAERCSRFVEDVGRHAGVTIARIPGLLRDVAPPKGFILLAAMNVPSMSLEECSPDRRAGLAARLVPIDVGRTRIFEELLEPLSVAAAVDSVSLWEWEKWEPAKGARGLHGRRDIGQIVGASCELWESARYCYLKSPTHRGLTHLLADYLAVLHRELQGECLSQ